MYRWLVDRDATDRAALQDYLRQGRTELDRAFLFLREINAASWHDHMHNPADVFELVRVIDRTFHPAYLRLVEGVLIPLVRVVAHFSRIDRGVGTDGLDAWPVVEEIRRGNNGTLVAPYRHVMRNAIAHGRITYLQDQIQYRDKRNRTETLTNQSVIWTTDDLVDVCHGIAAAVKVFLILTRRSRYPAPREFLVEDLAEETRSPWWYIDGCVESRIGPRSQLLVYAKTNSRDVNKVRFSAVQTGILAEALVQGFDRYFISMRSPVALPGWVAFDGAALRAARRSGKRDIEAYRGVIEGDLLFYAPRRRMSRLGGKVDTLRMAMSNAWRIVMRDLRGRLGVPDVLCRTAKVHRNGWGGVLQGSVVLGACAVEADGAARTGWLW